MAALRSLTPGPGSQMPARRAPPPVHIGRRAEPTLCVTPTAATIVTTVAPATVHFVLRFAGSSASTATIVSIEGHRASGFVASPPADDALRQGDDVLAREGALAVQRLVKRDAEGELIGALVDLLARELLHRHVRGRPRERPRARE